MLRPFKEPPKSHEGRIGKGSPRLKAHCKGSGSKEIVTQPIPIGLDRGIGQTLRVDLIKVLSEDTQSDCLTGNDQIRSKVVR